MLQSKIAGLQLKIHNMCHKIVELLNPKNSGTPESKRLELDPLEIMKAVIMGGVTLLSESH